MSFFGPDLRNGLPIGLGSLTALARAVAAVAPPPPATDSFFKYVTLLLHGDGTNGAQNNTFLDGSTNNFTITRNGNTTQGSFSPFSQTGWSNYFDGTGDYLTAPNNAAFDFGSGDFTIESWIYVTSNTPANQFIYSKRASSAAYSPILLYITKVGALYRLIYAGSFNGSTWGLNTSFTSGTIDIQLNSWVHVALVRSGSTFTSYVNGVGDQTFTGLASALMTNTDAATVAAEATNGGNAFNGYISNARIVKGTAVYTANFTPPTSPLTAITNTSLLTCQSNRFIDNSSNAFAITRNGDVRVEAFSPFNPSTTYSTANVGGSGYFDGTGDYLSVPRNNAFLPVANEDFTVEAWVYLTAAPTAAVIGSQIVGFGEYGADSDWVFGITTGLEASFYINATITSYTNTTTPLRLNTWNHVAASRSGTGSNNLTVYVNGVGQSFSVNSTTVGTGLRNLTIGADQNGDEANFAGYITNVRIVKGTAVYTSNFTPPTAPLTAITNTSLLLNFTNGGVFDNASQTVLETVGNAQVSTTQKKYGTGSMYFDGTDDRLVMPARPPMAVGSGNFTIEGWVYRLDTNTRGVFQLSGTAGGLQANTTTNLALGSDAGSVWRIYANNSAYNSTATWAINTWYHFALVRNSGTTTLYIDGTSVISQADTVNYTGQNLCIGGFYNTTFLMNGYIDDLRITNGYARYTANFTPPSAAFPDN